MLTLLTLQPGRASPAQPRVKSNFPCWPQSAVRLGGGGDVASWLFRRQQRPGCGQVTRVLGALHSTVADAFTEHVVVGKIFGNSFSFQATEMVLTSKWGRIQPEIQI